MPTYDYVCENLDCKYEFEHFQTMMSNHLSNCPECLQNTLKRLIGKGSAIIFKGQGFYCTDYKKPQSRPEGGKDGKLSK